MIPLYISPYFFLMAFLYGLFFTETMYTALLVALIIFISILVHEYGHAVTARFFGESPVIRLTLFGGTTYPFTKKVAKWKEFVTIFMGPMFSFLLFCGATYLSTLSYFQNEVAQYVLEITATMNFFWTVLNLLPIMPLDGGQLMRIGFESASPHNGVKYASLVSFSIAFLLMALSVTIGAIILTVFLALFGFQNYQNYSRLAALGPNDSDDETRQKLFEAESLADAGDDDTAISLLMEVRKVSKKGVVFKTATHDLAKIFIKKDQHQEAYTLLNSEYKKLTDDAKITLQSAAFVLKKYEQVLKIASDVLPMIPDTVMIERAIRSAAVLKQTKVVIGWLETYKSIEGSSLHAVLQSQEVVALSGEASIVEWLKCNKVDE